MMRIVRPLLALSAVLCSSAYACYNDILMCPNGEIIQRDAAKNCEFPACPSSDEGAKESACADDFFVCDNGEIVKRNPEKNCAFFPCESELEAVQYESAPVQLDAMGQQSPCLMDVFVCPGGYFVRRNESIACEFNPCPDFFNCAADIKICKDGVVLRRNTSNNCRFETCEQDDGQATVILAES